ncbi:hypothetical protein BUALT_Bualt06G0032100 [Buddleja alternifolia]|uniref:Cytochrome P450 n=1 Tax=Buddleja alternifolia TaxID=168488 RepID=A0AAV6XDQ7_9LAMI|nr:hypothetical protein BUALT_Bualt06G0032100 [Buddleja alternifolia]
MSSSLSSSPFSPYYHIIFTAFAFFVSGLLFILSRKSNSKKLKLPPGPPGYPVVGNLFQVARSGKPFFQYIRELIPKYGPIMTLKMGTRTMIIVSGADLAYEALIEKGQIFATRPRENPTRTIFSCDKFTVNAAYSGPVWRSLRRNMVQNMLSAARIREFRNARDLAMDKLIERLRDEAAANNGAVWVLKNARFAVFCILLTMCFGVEMDEETIERVDQMMKAVLIVLDPRLDDFLPILSPFFSKQRKRVQQVRKQQIQTLVPLIEKRRIAIRNPNSDESAASFSYLDTLFDLKIEGRNSSPTNTELTSNVHTNPSMAKRKGKRTTDTMMSPTGSSTSTPAVPPEILLSPTSECDEEMIIVEGKTEVRVSLPTSLAQILGKNQDNQVEEGRPEAEP